MSTTEWNCWAIGGWVALIASFVALILSLVGIANNHFECALLAAYLAVPLAWMSQYATDRLNEGGGRE